MTFETRTKGFQRNQNLESWISEMEQLLKPVEQALISQHKLRVRAPELYIIGSPRSGTTLLMQLIQASGLFNVPTNLLSRFYYSPYIGLKIQELIKNPELDHNGETLTSNETSFESNIGKTKGLFAANEFFHFWRQYFPYNMPSYLEQKDINRINFDQIRTQLSLMTLADTRPIACKGLFFQYNLEQLFTPLERPIFLHLVRNDNETMQSIYRARQSHNNNINDWWSVKPKEYSSLCDKNVFDQIAGQVHFTNKSIKQQSDNLPQQHVLTVNYCQLVNEPLSVIDIIRERYVEIGFPIQSNTNDSIYSFNKTNSILDLEICDSLSKSLNNLSSS